MKKKPIDDEVPFLPQAITDFLRRKMRQLWGLAVISSGLLLLGALVSYNTADPSFNVATSQTATNWLGLVGAYLADLLWQSLGLGALLLPIMLMAWGYRVMMGATIGYMRMRAGLVLPVLICLSAGFSFIPKIKNLELGGFVGRKLVALLTGWTAPIFQTFFAMGFILLGLISAYWLIGLKFKEWQGLARMNGAGVLWLYRCLGGVWRFGRRVQIGRGHKNEHEMIDDILAIKSGKSAKNPYNNPFLETSAYIDQANGRLVPPAGAEPERVEDARLFVEKNLATDRIKSKTEQVGERGAIKKSTKLAERDQISLAIMGGGDYQLPSVQLLSLPKSGALPISKESLAENARLLEVTLADFGVKGTINDIRPGPVVALYELEPAPGTKTNRVIGLADDIARSMSALSVRIATVPGRSVIGIELPNKSRESVYLRELLESKNFAETKARLPIILGKDIGGGAVIADLATMPHLLIAGTTGSGKSVGMNAMIISLLYRYRPDECKFIMVDPKMLELSVYDRIPHLLSPVVTDPKKAVVALKWAVREMEDRYRAMSRLSVRNIDGYNRKVDEALAHEEKLVRKVQVGFDKESGQAVYEEEEFEPKKFPYIVVVVDEMADLMLVAGKEIEASIQRLAQMARAAGIHLMMATQRPSVDVITGTIKANFPTRISFMVTSKIDSRTILGEQGAEQLLGKGDMLFMSPGGRINRVHGPFVEDAEVEKICEHLKAQGEPDYVDSVTTDVEEMDEMAQYEMEQFGGAGDGYYQKAYAVIVREGKASTSFIQRHLGVGYNKAAKIMEELEKNGVVGPANHVGKREVLVGNNNNAA